MKNLHEKFNKALQISDTDLDGGASVAISKILFPSMEYSIPKERHLIDSTLEDAIKSGNFSTIIMTDCSPSSDNTINLINEFVNDGNHFILLDHHKTALHLNKYSWSKVIVETNGVKHCGAELLYRYYKELGFDVDHLSEFAELVRCYDTWDWAKHDIKEADMMNKLFYYLGIKKFIDNISYKVSNNQELLTSKDYDTLDVIDTLDKQYIEEKKNSFITVEYNNMNVAVLFTDRCVSQLGNIICNENQDIDFCCIIDFNRDKCSLRSVKDHIDVSLIAKSYNGGGHSKASGFKFDSELKTRIVQNFILKNN